jgi:hypothetical protein
MNRLQPADMDLQRRALNAERRHGDADQIASEL